MRLKTLPSQNASAASGMLSTSEKIVIQPMSAPRMPAPPTMPGCGGTATWIASMMPAIGSPNLIGLSPAAFENA